MSIHPDIQAVLGGERRWTVITGDCLDVLRGLPEKCVDAVVTDPPFGIGFARQPTKWQRRAGMKPVGWDDQRPNVAGLVSIAPIVVVWGGNYFGLPTSRGWLAWMKPDAPPSMGNVELAWSSVNRTAKCITHSISATNKERVGHPTQKPVRVMEWTLETAKVPGDALVLDPYCGSGTTGVAAIKTGRRFIGIEIDEKYASIARERIAKAEAERLVPVG